jgi:hypothetical protein
MSSLTDVEKLYLEKVLGMGDGYVLSFNNPKFSSFFAKYKIDIDDQKYQKGTGSRANRMRAFWEQESDQLVGRVISDLLDLHVAECELNSHALDSSLIDKSREIVARLTGKKIAPKAVETEDQFLSHEFTIPNIQRLPVESQVAPIIEGRLNEALLALKAGAHLSVIFLCGSVLEGVLLGAAQKNPAKFNQAACSPKAKDGSAKQFHEWSLAQFIDVASEVGILKPDVKKFSHGLRDFRNYIHPYEQMVSGFTPDQHTAKVCFQVLKAALASVAGDRP